MPDALGGGLAYLPCILFIDQCFVKTSTWHTASCQFIWAGSGLTGILVPIILQCILNQFGFRTAFRVMNGDIVHH